MNWAGLTRVAGPHLPHGRVQDSLRETAGRVQQGHLHQLQRGFVLHLQVRASLEVAIL